MVTIHLTWRHCGSEHLVRNGLTTHAKQRCLGRAGGRRSRETPPPNGDTAAERETIVRADEARSSVRGLARTFGVSRNTVSRWLKPSPPPARQCGLRWPHRTKQTRPR